MRFFFIKTGLVQSLVVIWMAQFSLNVYAGLGERETSKTSNEKVYTSFTHSKAQGRLFTVHEMGNETTTIKEFLNADGVVFGITWSGAAQPNLSELMGIHRNEFKEIAGQKAAFGHLGKRASVIQGDHIVIERVNFLMRNQGRAYVPSLIPEGVAADEIK